MPNSAGPRPRLSVVVPTYDTRSLTLACLASLQSLRAPHRELEVVVVDDASTDCTADAIRERFPDVRVLTNERAVGFTAATNRGLADADGEILLVLNSDTEVAPDAWEVLDELFRRQPDLGVAGAQLHYSGDEPQWSGGREPDPLWLFALASGLPPVLARLPALRAVRPVAGWRADQVDWVTGAAMAIRLEVWEEIGPFDAAFQLYCQDLDFCTRVRTAGWRIKVAPGFRVLHHRGATVSQKPGAAGEQNPELLWSELVRWARKHGGPRRARCAARALSWGGRLRLAARELVTAALRGDIRDSFRRDSLAYERALAAIRREVEAIGEPASPTDESPPT